MAVTYSPIATQTLGSNSTTVTFSSIPSTYTDLVLVMTGNMSGNGEPWVQLNSDTASNYAATFMIGNGSTSYTGGTSNDTKALIAGHLNYWPNSSTTVATTIVQFSNYANTSTYKYFLSRDSQGASEVGQYIGQWRSTSAINTITISATNSAQYRSGTTFTIYGIKAA